MNTPHFSRWTKALAGTAMLVCALAVNAESKPAPAARQELILTIADNWPDADSRQFSSTLSENAERKLMLSDSKPRKPKVDVACNMDLNQNGVNANAALTERIGGNCELGYRY